MVREFRLSFEELNIVPNDLTSLLGFTDGVIPEPFPTIIDEAIATAQPFCDIRGGYKIFDSLEINRNNNSITIEEQLFLPSKIIVTQLKKATSAALYICSAGSGISDYSNKLANQGDPLLAYVFDVIGSVTVEKAMDKIQKKLELEMLDAGLTISDRYSPGYCDWSVSEQHYLFQLLPNNFCGVILSESSLMHPIKSVSGIIGIGKEMKQKGYQCDWCSDKNCIYGKIKRSQSTKG